MTAVLTAKGKGVAGRVPKATSARTLVTERDLALLADLWRFGALRRGQIHALHFADCALRRCNRRLKALADNGLIAAAPLPPGTFWRPGRNAERSDERRPGGCEFVYLARPPAAPLLARQMDRDIGTVRERLRDNGPAYLAHALEIADAALTFRRFAGAETADLSTSYRLRSFVPEVEARHAYYFRPDGSDGNGESDWKHALIRPDALAIVEVSRPRLTRLFWFVEVDRSAMAAGAFTRKIREYRQYHRTGAFAHRYGQPETGGGFSPSFLTLTLTTSERRAQNLCRLAEDEEAAFFRFTTADRFHADGPLAPIWHVPGQEEQNVSLLARDILSRSERSLS